MTNAHALRQRIVDQERQVAEAELELKRIEDSCDHKWNDPVYTPERHEGYRIPGDPPGTMGVDRQLPMDVPAKTIPKWTRTCPKCGKTEVTTKTEVVKVVEGPKF